LPFLPSLFLLAVIDALDQSYLYTSKVELKQYVNHPGEVNRARVNPERPRIVATKSPGPEVLVFDMSNYSSAKPKHNKVKSDLVLEGHSKRYVALLFMQSSFYVGCYLYCCYVVFIFMMFSSDS
jgi:hypothetical protein